MNDILVWYLGAGIISAHMDDDSTCICMFKLRQYENGLIHYLSIENIIVHVCESYSNNQIKAAKEALDSLWEILYATPKAELQSELVFWKLKYLQARV